MSAWVVSKTHIDLLVTAGLVFPNATSGATTRSGFKLNWYTEPPTSRKLGTLEEENATEVGVMLWAENYRSVDHRYPDLDATNELPGPEGFTGATTLTYTFQRIPGTLDPATVVKAIHCYEYQSCEHDEWWTSSAHAFCRALERTCMRIVPGYDEAPWGFDDPAYFTSRATVA